MLHSPKTGDIKTGKEIGRTGNRKWIWHACEDCGKERWVSLRIVNPNKPSSRFCLPCGIRQMWKRPGMKLRQSEVRKGEKCYAWKGGKAKSRHRGYVFIKLRPFSPFYSMANQDVKISGAYIAEHRLVMAQYLDRCLGTHEIVHHKNGIRDDNRIENLELTTPGSHIKDHSKGYKDGYQAGYEKGLSDGNSDERRMKKEIQEATGIPTEICTVS